MNLIQTQIREGTILGKLESGVCRFSAIPYAQAPVGSLRWCAPQPAHWRGTLDATRPGPVSPQLPSRLRGAMGDFEAEQSEDCLHLTVWTPAVDQRRRPVVVWLHGGAWQSGAGALDWYSGAYLAARGDVVVVAPNYRLAALGWLYVPGETANVGLLDQEAALAWTRENIESFGGDPEQITVMGQSAGGTNIACLMTRKPVFQRAILQSASLGRGIRSAAQAERLSQVLLQAAGVRNLAQARQLPWQDWLKAQTAPEVAQALQAEGGRRSLFAPVADGEVLALDVEQQLQTQASAQMDVLLGYTAHEMRAFPGMPAGSQGDLLGNQVFGAPTRAWAQRAVASGRKAWLYRFDVAPSAQFGACHCIELPFVFDTLPSFAHAPMLEGLPAEKGRALVQEMQGAWLDFIHGRPLPWPLAPEMKCFD